MSQELWMVFPDFLQCDPIPMLVSIDHQTASIERHIIDFGPYLPAHSLKEINQPFKPRIPNGIFDLFPLVPVSNLF